MSITLEDSAGNLLKVNAWNWGMLHHTVVLAFLYDDDTSARLRNGRAVLTGEKVVALLAHLEETLLPALQPGERLLYDLSVTGEPDDGTFYRDELEKNYSLHYEVLTAIIEYLRTAEPPVICR
jgi:hypothetical protein